MRAVATALVLIAGAAVILWYGSTLNNSWVLGGLIGGLAALLLSIPISLTLFSHLSRRHDEHLRVEEEEERRFAREYDDYEYPALPARRPYAVEGTVIYEDDDEGEEGEDAYDEDDEIDEAYWREEEQRRRDARRPSAPGVARSRNYQRQTTTRQATTNVNNRLPGPAPQAYLPAPRQQPQQAQHISQSTQQSQSLKTPRRDTKSLRSGSLQAMSQHRMEALRTARREAARESDEGFDDIEVSPTNHSRVERSVRPGQPVRKRFDQDGEYQQYPESRFSERPSKPSNPRKSGDAGSLASQRETQRTSTDTRSRLFNSRDDSEDMRSTEELSRSRRESRKEPRTDYIDNQLPRTEPVRRPRTRDLQSSKPSSTSETDTTDSIYLNRPLVRRAPYLYDDDDLREQFAQQIEQMDPPRVRRSSKQQVFQDDEE